MSEWHHPVDKVNGWGVHVDTPATPDVESDADPEPVGHILGPSGDTLAVVMPPGWRPRRPIGFVRGNHG